MPQEVGLQDVYEGIEAAFKSQNYRHVEALLWPAVDQYPEDGRLWFYGGCLLFKQDRPALAARCFHRAIDLDDAPHIYSNLGACYRRMNLHEQGLAILRSALDRTPNYAPALVNVGSMYVNEGRPEQGIPYLERAIEIGGERGAVWNLGLLYLESGRFAEGFDLYREGVHHERAVRCYGSVDQTIPEPAMLTPEAVAEARSSGRKPRLAVWGEQGIGDELMFGTIIEEARADFDVTFECHPRLQRLHHNAHPGLMLYPTRKEEWITWPVTEREVFEYKAPIGDLACYYRRDLDSFKAAWQARGACYRANPVETASYREQLLDLAAGRPIVAIATRGGVLTTAREYRTIRIPDLDRLIESTEAVYVCVDYDDMFSTSTYMATKHGEGRWRWYPAICQHWDYDHTAALLAACDLTVTVCQSVAHLSAGMGLPTRVLTPIRCAWRYAPVGEEPDLWYWYPSPEVKIYRQDDPDSWAHPLDRVIEDVRALNRPKVATVSPAPAVVKGLSMGRSA